MRNLSRIIFINSANIPYSDDIYLDGNVHFIGTQGVGKSTLLRAILFFYNADTQRLGISVEKQNYTDYYFPYSNSYIVYEVATENGAFCILSFKSMNRVCYRFIHSPYRKEFFIDKNRVAYSESDRVRAVLDQYGIEYSRIIYTYDEYRNILYGNSTSPEFSRYSLMESKQYQNIPRTIQNVLLNSKLDAEFIKKTIISSLNEDETAIDLNSYKEHLKNFETRLKDIEEFQKRETRKQAREITLLSQQTSKLQGGLVQNCRELVAAFRKAESILPQWKEKQDRTDADKGKLIRRKQELQDESRKRSDKLQEALAVLNNELQKALGKEKDYQNKNTAELCGVALSDGYVPDIRASDGHEGFYAYYQLDSAGEPDDSETEPGKEGELRTRYEGSHSPFGFVWQIASATGWSVDYILDGVNYQTLIMMLNDAPRYVRKKQGGGNGAPRPEHSAEDEANDIVGFFQSKLE